MIVIDSIASALGNLKSIEHLASPTERPLRSFLMRDGFRYYSEATASITNLAERAIIRSLAKSKLKAHEITAIIFSTESFWDVNSQTRSKSSLKWPPQTRIREVFLQLIARKLGMINATPYASWLMGCGNFSNSLILAKSLIVAGLHKNVMVVLADRVMHTTKRIASSGLTIFSDGAVALILSEGNTGYEIKNTFFHFSPQLTSRQNKKNILIHGRTLLLAAYSFAQKLDNISHPVDKHDLLLTDNIHSMSLSFACSAFGVKPSCLQTPLKRHGHFFSADCPLGLAAMESRGKVTKGDLIGLLNFGPYGFGFTSLRML